MTPEYDAAVIGAGPAGSAAAAILAGRGRRVILLEKDHLPRAKVCGEFLAADARDSLSRLGVLARLEEGAERIDRGSVHLPGGRTVAFRLAAPAIGVSRFRMDELLARRAGELGAEVRFGVRVGAIEPSAGSGFRLHCSGAPEKEVVARGVIGAWGRWDALDRTLRRSFLRRRARFFAWSRDYVGDTGDLAGRVLLFVFPGGYCGLSRVEGGAVNLAGVIAERARRRLAPGWQSVLEHVRATNDGFARALSRLREGPIGFLGTGPVYFTGKPPVEGGMLLAGDAAGVIDPFSGEGQTVALASGILAAEALDRGLGGEIPIERVPEVYRAAWRRRFGRRFHWSALFRGLMLSPRLAAAAAPWIGERLVRVAIERLRAPAPGPITWPSPPRE